MSEPQVVAPPAAQQPPSGFQVRSRHLKSPSPPPRFTTASATLKSGGAIVKPTGQGGGGVSMKSPPLEGWVHHPKSLIPEMFARNRLLRVASSPAAPPSAGVGGRRSSATFRLSNANLIGSPASDRGDASDGSSGSAESTDQGRTFAASSRAFSVHSSIRLESKRTMTQKRQQPMPRGKSASTGRRTITRTRFAMTNTKLANHSSLKNMVHEVWGHWCQSNPSPSNPEGLEEDEGEAPISSLRQVVLLRQLVPSTPCSDNPLSSSSSSSSSMLSASPASSPGAPLLFTPPATPPVGMRTGPPCGPTEWIRRNESDLGDHDMVLAFSLRLDAGALDGLESKAMGVTNCQSKNPEARLTSYHVLQMADHKTANSNSSSSSSSRREGQFEKLWGASQTS
mmetsp:Transcript_11676/g.22479  ORF Transcript_11676/g.22479 Transcript_11676/m.22479 type:complete len:396 (-) Transcript_11676:932-2119(-)